MQDLCKQGINEAKRLERPKRWVDMARDVGKESWEGKLTRLEDSKDCNNLFRKDPCSYLAGSSNSLKVF